jgi:hypothetical protein
LCVPSLLPTPHKKEEAELHFAVRPRLFLYLLVYA